MFTWIPFYEEFAEKLRAYANRQDELIAFLEELRAQGMVITPLEDKDAANARFTLTEIDPFTFFGCFNRRINEHQRIAILAAAKQHFGISAPVPSDFAGIPILDNRRSWFFQYQPVRGPDDIARLWSVFEAAFAPRPMEDPTFETAFNEALKVKGTSVNLTIGLFWIRPSTFLSVDGVMRGFLGIQLPSTGLTFHIYKTWHAEARAKGKSFPELSLEAFSRRPASEPSSASAAVVMPIGDLPEENSYWLVGAYWRDMEPPDQTERFLEEEIWENGFEDKHLDLVKSMKVGDRIAIKAATVQKHDLPFDAKGRSVSKILVKAVGVITQNFDDGRRVKVEWQPVDPPREWYFYTYQGTIWRLKRDDPWARELIDFVFRGVPQNYSHFTDYWFSPDGPFGPEEIGQTDETVVAPVRPAAPPYSIDDLLDEGIFLDKSRVKDILDRLRSKKNVVLQGPPGVGKTFVARRLAYAFLEKRDPSCVEVVQFHQSYSYEDFVRGYRPAMVAEGASPGFSLIDGPFLQFCQRAERDDQPYVFIIDEMNRGNLSQIFGELLMLLEADKRGAENAVTLAYPRSPGERFSIPENVYVLGMMNVADRSLAMVDYALRRRFAFITLEPQFSNPMFKGWLLKQGMKEDLIDLVVTRLSELNESIGSDPNLGPMFKVGHSFFIPASMDAKMIGRSWFDSIIETEIAPLLQEYWHGEPGKAQDALSRLRA